MSRERTRELYTLNVEATDTNPAYAIREEIKEIEIPGFEDCLTRGVFILSYDGDDREFINLRGAKKEATKLIKEWRIENGIAVGSVSSNVASPDMVQRKLVKAHAGLLKTNSQLSEAGINGKIAKKLEKTIESLSACLDLLEGETKVSNESIVEAIEAHKAKLAESRKAKKTEDSE